MILDESHFKDLLNQHTSPPPASVSKMITLKREGQLVVQLYFLSSSNDGGPFHPSMKANLEAQRVTVSVPGYLNII